MSWISLWAGWGASEWSELCKQCLSISGSRKICIQITWTDFKTFGRNKLWCSGISCFVLLKKRGDVCWEGGKIPNLVFISHNFLQMWIMFAIIFITLFSSAPQMKWPQGTDWCPLAIFLGQLWLHLPSPLCCRSLCMDGERTGLHAHVDFDLFLKLLLFLFFKGQFPFVFKYLKGFFAYTCHSTWHN